MNQDSYQTDNKNTPSNEHNPSRQKNKAVWYWVIIGILVMLCFYLFFSRKEVIQQNIIVSDQRDEAIQDRDTLQGDFNAALARLDLLTGKNAQLDSLVNNKESEIANLRAQIQRILTNTSSTAKDFSRAKGLIAQLNKKVKSYEERIAELERDNAQLSSYSELLQEERDETVARNIALSQQVKLGAVLHASNLRMTAIDLRQNGKKEKETERASKVDFFRISFDIDENRLAEDGLKNLYIRILDYKGSLLRNTGIEAGEITTSDGESIPFSITKQIALKQGEPLKNIEMDWKLEKALEPGNYTLEIYHEGYKIGTGKVPLK
jgi:predicted  nucleic acid-binding Zn-ribbon protein